MTTLANIIGWPDSQFEEWLRLTDTVTLIELLTSADPNCVIGFPVGTAGNEWFILSTWVDDEMDPNESRWLIDVHHEHLRRAIKTAVTEARALSRLGVITEH